MDLRPELMPPPLPSKKVLREIQKRIKEINHRVEDLREDATELIEEFNRFTGRDYNAHVFRKYYTVMSIEEFAAEASRPLPKPASNVTVKELVEIVRRAMPTHAGDADFTDMDYYALIFETNVSMPNASSLIHYPLDYDAKTNTWGGGRPMGEYDPSPEEIVRIAMSYGGADQR